VTAVAPADTFSRCHELARTEGLPAALTVLVNDILPGLLPCGPSGHAVVPAEIHAWATGVWLNGTARERRRTNETTLATAELRGGDVVLVAYAANGEAAEDDRRDAWTHGLVWLRLGLSEALRADCLTYLAARRAGDSTLLQQQLVKGILADALVEHLEVRAVLTGTHPGELDAGTMQRLHDQLTTADRALVKLLGASSLLQGGPGATADVSELLAEVYLPGEEWP
jgi:hypothetical protein